ncbi:MAG: hypothetical protein LBF41_06870 [Deltaproteobacteria bacterium]|jgi:hypothetical protein|nr:hypothetical protein [Deltaproteobacteria bacterium]
MTDDPRERTESLSARLTLIEERREALNNKYLEHLREMGLLDENEEEGADKKNLS